jgi:hypothetical protein
MKGLKKDQDFSDAMSHFQAILAMEPGSGASGGAKEDDGAPALDVPPPAFDAPPPAFDAPPPEPDAQPPAFDAPPPADSRGDGAGAAYEGQDDWAQDGWAQDGGLTDEWGWGGGDYEEEAYYPQNEHAGPIEIVKAQKAGAKTKWKAAYAVVRFEPVRLEVFPSAKAYSKGSATPLKTVPLDTGDLDVAVSNGGVATKTVVRVGRHLGSQGVEDVVFGFQVDSKKKGGGLDGEGWKEELLIAMYGTEGDYYHDEPYEGDHVAGGAALGQDEQLSPSQVDVDDDGWGGAGSADHALPDHLDPSVLDAGADAAVGPPSSPPPPAPQTPPQPPEQAGGVVTQWEEQPSADGLPKRDSPPLGPPPATPGDAAPPLASNLGAPPSFSPPAAQVPQRLGVQSDTWRTQRARAGGPPDGQGQPPLDSFSMDGVQSEAAELRLGPLPQEPQGWEPIPSLERAWRDGGHKTAEGVWTWGAPEPEHELSAMHSSLDGPRQSKLARSTLFGGLWVQQGRPYQLQRLYPQQRVCVAHTLKLTHEGLHYALSSRPRQGLSVSFLKLRNVGVRVQAMGTWDGASIAEGGPKLSFLSGDYIVVVSTDNGYWSQGYIVNDPQARIGAFPTNIVRHIDELHADGGVFEMRDEYGTTVHFTLPRAGADDSAIVDGNWAQPQPNSSEWIFALNALGDRARLRERGVVTAQLEDAEQALAFAKRDLMEMAATMIQRKFLQRLRKRDVPWTIPERARATAALELCLMNMRAGHPPFDDARHVQTVIDRVAAKVPNQRLLDAAKEELHRLRDRCKARRVARSRALQKMTLLQLCASAELRGNKAHLRFAQKLRQATVEGSLWDVVGGAHGRGDTAMHVLCQNPAASSTMLHALSRAAPDLLTRRNADGHTPTHYLPMVSRQRQESATANGKPQTLPTGVGGELVQSKYRSRLELQSAVWMAESRLRKAWLHAQSVQRSQVLDRYLSIDPASSTNPVKGVVVSASPAQYLAQYRAATGGEPYFLLKPSKDGAHRVNDADSLPCLPADSKPTGDASFLASEAAQSKYSALVKDLEKLKRKHQQRRSLPTAERTVASMAARSAQAPALRVAYKQRELSAAASEASREALQRLYIEDANSKLHESVSEVLRSSSATAVDTAQESVSSAVPTPSKSVVVTVVHDYTPPPDVGPRYMALAKGQQLHVTNSDDPLWWEGEAIVDMFSPTNAQLAAPRIGFFPSPATGYTEEWPPRDVQEPEARGRLRGRLRGRREQIPEGVPQTTPAPAPSADPEREPAAKPRLKSPTTDGADSNVTTAETETGADSNVTTAETETVSALEESADPAETVSSSAEDATSTKHSSGYAKMFSRQQSLDAVQFLGFIQTKLASGNPDQVKKSAMVIQRAWRTYVFRTAVVQKSQSYRNLSEIVGEPEVSQMRAINNVFQVIYAQEQEFDVELKTLMQHYVGSRGPPPAGTWAACHPSSELRVSHFTPHDHRELFEGLQGVVIAHTAVLLRFKEALAQHPHIDIVGAFTDVMRHLPQYGAYVRNDTNRKRILRKCLKSSKTKSEPLRKFLKAKVAELGSTALGRISSLEGLLEKVNNQMLK